MTEAKLNGKWKFLSSDNFENYMKKIGVNIAIRKLASLSKPDVVIQIEGDEVLYKSISTARTTEVRCKIGKSFVETVPNGGKTQSIMYWEGDKLLHKQEWDGLTSIVARYVDGDGNLVMEFTLDDVRCVRKFKRDKGK